MNSKEPLKNIFSTAPLAFLLQIFHRSSLYRYLIQLRRSSKFSLKNASGSLRKSVFQRFLRNLLIFILSLSLVLFTQMARFSASAGDNDPGDPEDIVEEYHETINDMFNIRIKNMVELMSNDDEPLTEQDLAIIYILISPPALILDENGKVIGRRPCQGNDERPALSTYCLAQDATEKYFFFRQTMMEARKAEKEKAVQQFKSDTGKEPEDASQEPTFQQTTMFGAIADLFQGEKKLQKYGETINQIDLEIDIARQSLDAALSAYNELQMALPLHRKYQEVIEVLETYRDKISDVRQEVDLYPVTFLDVTTTQCQ